MAAAICEGAKGFIVGRLQAAIGNLKVDDDFGGKTAAAVRDVQTALGFAATGNADEDIFNACRARWPTEFERCLMLTAAFEGTGFGGVNRRDIDGAGVTLGIAGFTTWHGEVQRLITDYTRILPSVLHDIPSAAKEKLLILTRTPGRNSGAWEHWFYGVDGKVDGWIRDIIARWGDDPLYQRLQLDMIETEMWHPALATARTMGLKSTAALGLLFDCQVQNGGFADRHRKHYNAQSHDGSERGKMLAIVNAVTACAAEKWQADVHARKITYVDGGSKVHGTYYDLSDYGF